MYYIQIAGGTLQTCEELLITSARLNYAANGIDTFDFAADSALTAAGIAFGTAVKVYDVALCIFIGEVLMVPSDEEVSSPGQKKYKASSYLNQLDRVQYTQDINAYNVIEAEVQPFIDPRVVLGLRYPDTRITNTAQIAAVLDFAHEIKGVPISRDVTWPAGFLAPIDQKENIFCWDAVVSQLRWLVDHVLWCDYSTGSTVVKLVKESTIEATVVTVTGEMSGITATPRHDLQMIGLNVFFRKVGTFDGAAIESRTVQTAGNNMSPFATNLYVDLDGGSTTMVRQAIKVEAYPDFDAPYTDPYLKLWLEDKAPWLKDITGYEIGLIEWTGAHEYKQELKEGVILKWMPVSFEEETITTTVSYEIKDAEGNYIEIATIKIPVQVTSCNGTSKTYSKPSSSDSGEAEPAGLAAGLFSSWSKLHWDGNLSSYIPKIGYVRPGARINIIGAHESLATMAAIVQSSSVDLNTRSIELIYGTCRAIEADSYTALYRAIRYRRSSSYMFADISEEEAIENDDTSILATPKGSAGQSPGTARTQIGTASTGDRTASMSSDDLTSGDAAKFRETKIVVDADTKETVTVKVLRTATDAEAEQDKEDEGDCGNNLYPGGGDGSGAWGEIPPYDIDGGGIYGDGSGADDTYPGKSNDCW